LEIFSPVVALVIIILRFGLISFAINYNNLIGELDKNIYERAHKS